MRAMSRRTKFGKGWIGVVMIALTAVLAVAHAVRLARFASGLGELERLDLVITVFAVVFYTAFCAGLVIARRRLRRDTD